MSNAALSLDLEFEDEQTQEEVSKSAELLNEHANVEIEFSVISGGVESSDGDYAVVGTNGEEVTEKAPLAAVSDSAIKEEPAANIENREDNSQIIEFNKVEVEPEARAKNTKYKFGEELKRMSENNSLLKSEVEASIKIKVLEGSTELLLAKAQEAKVLEHQVNEIIGRIHKKVPGLKPELLRLRKILSDYSDSAKKTNIS